MKRPDLDNEQRGKLLRIIVSALLLVGGYLPLGSNYISVFLFGAAYVLIGWDVLWQALRNIWHGQVLDENFLMALATIGAFAIGKYPEGAAVMLFYQIGDLTESLAVGKSRRSIAALMDIRPDYANIEKDGQLVQVEPDEIAVGDIIVIKAGEKVPLDGAIVSGSSTLDTAALTGESLPRAVRSGDEVISGCINLNGLLRVKVSKPFAQSTVNKILELVENSAAQKANSENFITRFARYYTPLVVGAALLLAVAAPLVLGGSWSDWLNRALVFLVVSCPCALVLSVPLTFFGGIGAASRCGVLVKGGNYLEALASLGIVVFDKTGTLTKGVFKVTVVHPEKYSAEELLELAALAESYSDHPISRSLQEAYGRPLDYKLVGATEEIAGHGVRSVVGTHVVWVGNEKLMRYSNVRGWDLSCDCRERGTVVHVAVDDIYAGHILIADEVKPDAEAAITALKAAGVRQTAILTGDSETVALRVAAQLGIDEVFSGLLPADKVDRLEVLLQKKHTNEKLAFVGDGINDAPVLARADIGISMGALGSDAAIEAADIVLMDDQPGKIVQAMAVARKTCKIVRQNIVFALGIKFLVLLLGALGMANLWGAVFADVGVLIIAVLNASRMLLPAKTTSKAAAVE